MANSSFPLASGVAISYNAHSAALRSAFSCSTPSRGKPRAIQCRIETRAIGSHTFLIV